MNPPGAYLGGAAAPDSTTQTPRYRVTRRILAVLDGSFDEYSQHVHPDHPHECQFVPQPVHKGHIPIHESIVSQRFPGVGGFGGAVSTECAQIPLLMEHWTIRGVAAMMGTAPEAV